MSEPRIRLKQLLPQIGMSRSAFLRIRDELEIPRYKPHPNSRIVLYILSEVLAVIDQWRGTGEA